MALTYDQVQQAYNDQQAAIAALQAAQAEEEAIGRDPARFAREGEGAKAKSRAAQGAVTRATQAYTKVSTQYNKENPTKPAQTPGQKATDEGRIKQQEELDRNYAQTGIRETDVQRATREGRNQPKPPRADSPAQTTQAATGQVNAQTGVTNANSTIARGAETTRHNLQTESQNAINAQRDALYKAGLLYKDTRQQVSQEAQTGYTGETKLIDTSVGAAKEIASNETTRRGQDIDLTKARQTFVSGVLNTALPQVVELMLKTDKGSKVAGNFLKAYLTIANSAWKTAGLDKEPPPIDMTSPHMQTLTRWAGYGATAKIPEMPTTAQINGNTAAAMAVAGAPVIGWQGPIGIEATKIPPFPPGTNGDGVNVLNDAEQSAEGKALKQKIAAGLQGVPTDPAQQTPEQKAMVEAAKQAYQSGLQDIATKKAATTSADPAVTDAQALKDEIRSGLISDDPKRRINLMMAAKTAMDNKAAGRPLTPDQTALLTNIDPADLDLIRQGITPEAQNIYTRFQQGQKPTAAEAAAVQTVGVNVSTAVKNRPLTPAAAAQAGSNDQQIDPAVVAAQQAEHEAKRQEREKIAQENPDLGAMMAQVEAEQGEQGRQARESGTTVDFAIGPTATRDEAQQRLDRGEKARQEFYQGPQAQPKIMTPNPLTGPNLDFGTTPKTQRQAAISPAFSSPETHPPLDLTNLYGGGNERPSMMDFTPTPEPPSPPELAPLFQNYEPYQPPEEERPPMPSLFNPTVDWR